MDITIEVDAHGHVFDGSWEPIIQAYCISLENKLGDDAVRMIRTYLPTQYMYLGHNGGNSSDNPVPPDAGFLVAHIMAHRDTDDSVLVTDGGYPAMIYGPWIEGIAPGNLYFGAVGRTQRGLNPRFPGYHAFQRTTGILNMTVEDIANTELPPSLALINE